MFCQRIIFCFLLFCLFELFKCPENATFYFKTYLHFSNNYGSFEKGNLCLLTEFYHLTSSTFSKEKGRGLTGIGGGVFYFCFEELRCDLLKQCSSKRFVEKGWYIQHEHQRGWGERVVFRESEREREVWSR